MRSGFSCQGASPLGSGAELSGDDTSIAVSPCSETGALRISRAPLRAVWQPSVMASLPPIPLPKGWPRHVAAGVVQAAGLAHFALTRVRGWCADSRIARVRLAARCGWLEAELARVLSELRILRARLSRVPPRSRPHYLPEERLAILALRAARAWSVAETARRFLVTAATVAAWMRRLNEGGPGALVRPSAPVNRFPDFVAELVRQLKGSLPTMGRVRIAQLLGRAGLHLAPTTVRRFLNKPPPKPKRPPPPSNSCNGAHSGKPHRIVSRCPHHTWHVDFSLVSITGLWAPWLPFALPQRWPFCWWVAAVVDHFSRAVVIAEVFRHEPDSAETRVLLQRAIAVAGRTPKYIITDRGTQFRSRYRQWCAERGIRPRFGAIGKKGSIAVIERFWRSLKDECFRIAGVPLALPVMRCRLADYVHWHNAERPHQALRGATPAERLAGAKPRIEQSGFETRVAVLARAPPGERRRPGERLRLIVRSDKGGAHLPTVRLRKAA